MDYELMMNGNVKIGQRAPEFKATTTMGNIELKQYLRQMVNFIFTSGRFYPSVLSFQTLKSADIKGF